MNHKETCLASYSELIMFKEFCIKLSVKLKRKIFKSLLYEWDGNTALKYIILLEAYTNLTKYYWHLRCTFNLSYHWCCYPSPMPHHLLVSHLYLCNAYCLKWFIHTVSYIYLLTNSITRFIFMYTEILPRIGGEKKNVKKAKLSAW